MAVPIEGVPTDQEDREKCEWWKAKKWAYGILGRLFHRFVNPSQLPSPMQSKYGVFAEHFVTTFTPEIFKVYLHQVELYVSGQAWLGKKCQYQFFQFFTECIKPKSTWILLKPHVDSLMANFAFPSSLSTYPNKLCGRPILQNTVSYAKDEYENFSSPISGATSFLLSLASNCTKTSFLSMLQFINTVLRSNPTPAQRFGALTMMSVLSPFIVRHPDVKGSIEQFMVQFVLPKFTSQEPYLQSVACEVFGVVTKASITWTTE
ncbi:armadillo-type protein [Suillus cothurnatus]|nr:armadillo-type protein [Suillus cothurnatus]